MNKKRKPPTVLLALFSNFLLAVHSPGAEPKPLSDNPPGNHYGMTFQKIELLREISARGSK